jgi:arsenite oxidase small subunit
MEGELMADEPGPSNPERRSGITRRRAVIGGGAVAVAGGAAAAIVIATSGDGDGEGEDYPRRRIAGTGELRRNRPVQFEYPLKGQRSVLLDLGEEVPGGVGDNASIVAYSVLCQHMGCPVGYRAAEQDFLCGCHQSRYDPAREGVVVQGVSQRPLPRVALEVDGEDIFAVGVEGLIYGYRSNLDSGQSAA